MNEHSCTAACNHATDGTDPDLVAEFAASRQAVLHDESTHASKRITMDQTATLRSTATLGTVATPHGGTSIHYFLPANKDTVVWGYFSRQATPALRISSGDYVTIETLTHHANDDAARMVTGDQGAESVFLWTSTHKNIDRRGMGAMDAAVGAGGGLGVHICTGPVHVEGAMPGDVLEVRIIDITPRPSANPLYAGKTFGSNAAANWGFHYGDTLTEPKQREVITVYELDASGKEKWARAVYNYRWTPQRDPFGVMHSTIDYPGVPVDH